MKEFRIWRLYTAHSFQLVLINRPAAIMLFLGKSLRIALFALFLLFLFQGAKSLAGYSKDQIIFFYLSFNLVDTLAQLFFREVYRFRALVVSGNLDLVFAKPVNPLLRVLLGGADLFDTIMFFILCPATLLFAYSNFHPSLLNVFLYFALLLNGLAIAFSFHVLVLGLGIITTSVDNLIMIYRDMTSLMRIPSDVYTQPLRFLLTFVLPLGIMITFPAKALLGLLSWQSLLFSVAFSSFAVFLSLKFWNFSIKKYSSASS